MTDAKLTVPLAHGRSLTLRLEPGRIRPLWSVGVWGLHGMQGGLQGDAASMRELLGALEHLARMVDREGLPGEAS